MEKGDNKSEQYYNNVPTSKAKPRSLNIAKYEKNFSFSTDSGVFSKSKLDDGSVFLVDTIVAKYQLMGNVLDLGCGYGTIGILLSKVFEGIECTMCDVNERAVDLARKNIAANGLLNVEAIVSDVVANISKSEFDYVVTNPPIRAGNSVLFHFFEKSYEKLKPGGLLFLVLRKKQGAETYIKKLGGIFASVEVLDKQKGYVAVCAKK